MTLEELGYNEELENYRKDRNLDSFEVGRVISEHKERYVVKTADKVLIYFVFPRKTLIERQAVGKQGEKQIIATNIDYAFIVQAVDRDFNINRIDCQFGQKNGTEKKQIKKSPK